VQLLHGPTDAEKGLSLGLLGHSLLKYVNQPVTLLLRLVFKVEDLLPLLALLLLCGLYLILH
jgi:hypothetical protein